MKCITVRLHTVLIAAALVLGAAAFCVLQGPRVVSAIATSRALPIYSVAREEKQIALTFDTSYGDNTTELLRVLSDAGVSATFFVTGDWADRHGESVRAMHTAGHEVMNHSNTHPHMTRLSASEIRAEVEACGAKIKALTGTMPTLFRPPFGDYDDHMIATLQQCGMVAVHWDVDSLDWKAKNAAEIKKRVLEKTRPGSILLFHCGMQHTPEALAQLLPALKQEGYRIVPLGEHLYQENFTIDSLGRQIPHA